MVDLENVHLGKRFPLFSLESRQTFHQIYSNMRNGGFDYHSFKWPIDRHLSLVYHFSLNSFALIII